MARRNPNTPEPFPWGPKDGETLATAYARRAPGKRPGKEHWHWELSFKDKHGKRKLVSLGRLPCSPVRHLTVRIRHAGTSELGCPTTSEADGNREREEKR